MNKQQYGAIVVLVFVVALTTSITANSLADHTTMPGASIITLTTWIVTASVATVLAVFFRK
jgi:hypothetical protein